MTFKEAIEAKWVLHPVGVRLRNPNLR